MKLSKRQRTALKKSIVKWELIVDGKLGDKGGDNCELCIVNEETGCSSCPVAIKANTGGCHDTPWIAWVRYQGKNGFSRVDAPQVVFDEKSKELAQAELDFLRSILAGAS